MDGAPRQRAGLRRKDALAIALVGVLVAGGVAWGIGHALAVERSLEQRAGRAGGRLFFGTGAFGHGDASREGVDPYAPPGLPQGVGIDPETGWMRGLELRLGPDETALSWDRLADYDLVDGVGAPPELAGLAGRPVVLTGFLKAVYEFTDIREFLLVGSHLACCFGIMPGPLGMVEVRLAAGEAPLDRLVVPILVRGTLRIAPLRETPDPDSPVVLLLHVDDATVSRLDKAR